MPLCGEEHDGFHPDEFQDQKQGPQRPNQNWPLARLGKVKLGLTQSGLSGPLYFGCPIPHTLLLCPLGAPLSAEGLLILSTSNPCY